MKKFSESNIKDLEDKILDAFAEFIDEQGLDCYDDAEGTDLSDICQNCLNDLDNYFYDNGRVEN